MERLHILDGYGYIFRAHYGMANAGRRGGGPRLTSSDGMPTNALHVYANMLMRLHQEESPGRMVVVFDDPGKNFRDELDPNYKQTRRDTPEDLLVQMPHFRPLTEAFCWPVISVPGVEADDTIATIAARARERGWEVVIHSGDKDLMQLIGDGVCMVDSMRGITYDRDRVIDKFGVSPENLGDWLALVGDSSDNVPGMVGVGKVGATKLLTAYGDLQGILRNVDELKGKQKERFCQAENIQQLELSRKLVTLKDNVELPADLDSFVPGPWDSAPLEAICVRLGFTGLLARLTGKDSASRAPEAPAPQRSSLRVAFEATAARVITERAELEAEVVAAREAGRLVVQLESDGARHDRERMVGLGLLVPGRAPVYLPVAHRYLGAPPALDRTSLDSLAAVLATPEVAIVCHDCKRLRRVLGREDIELRGTITDLLLASYLLDPSADSQKPEECLAQWVETALPARETHTGKGKKAVAWDMVEVGHAASYVGPLLGALEATAERVAQELDEHGLSSLFRDIEVPLALVLAEMEARGIALDEGALAEIRDQVGARIAELEARIFALAGGPFNVGSPKQLSALLFETLGLESPIKKKTKTGHSTDHEVLEAMVDLHEIIEPLIEHRELVKLKGTYIDSLPPLVSQSTGRLHTSFRQDVAATGRLSSQDPNLQNIPIRSDVGRSIRRAFIAPAGRQLISADYSQIELRIMAHLSEDPVLVRAFREGIDVHTQTAAEVFDMPVAEVGPAERRVAKAVNYGLIYGQSDFGLGRALGISRAEAGTYIRRYFERFSKVRIFMDEIVRRAREDRAAFTVCGRKRPIPGIADRNHRVRSAAERIAQNTPMQGSAADIMKLAMLRVDALLRDTRSRMLLTVHDELIIEADADEATEVGARVREAMETAYELIVPLVVDVGVASSWADAH